MRLATQRQIVDFLRQRGAPRSMRAALGDYSEDDPNVFTPDIYSEQEAFNGGAGGTQGSYTVMPAQAIPPFLQRNITVFALYPFQGAAGIQQTILNANDKRSLLIVQNQNAAGGADLYINFSSDASVNNGLLIGPQVGLIFDTVCPNNGISIFSTGGAIKGCAVEGVSAL